MTERDIIAWTFAVAGAVCGIAAAGLHGGLQEALTAASPILGGMAAVWGYTGKPKTP